MVYLGKGAMRLETRSWFSGGRKLQDRIRLQDIDKTLICVCQKTPASLRFAGDS